MPGIHFRLRMTDTEIASLAAREIDDLVVRLLPQVFEPVQLPADHPPERTQALAQLHLLTFVQQAVEHLKGEAAHHAADAGAGYPQIGRASNMTRQGARRRWPGLTEHQSAAPADAPQTEPGSTR
ncbi:hypothetical protein ACFWNK_22605 [Streptomyces sp. NPDC058417]|uniref:hypothetical protein n=1 Tax=unclassified Streptomyces TaxID=2593676 RepID=UPI0036546952